MIELEKENTVTFEYLLRLDSEKSSDILKETNDSWMSFPDPIHCLARRDNNFVLQTVTAEVM